MSAATLSANRYIAFTHFELNVGRPSAGPGRGGKFHRACNSMMRCLALLDDDLLLFPRALFACALAIVNWVAGDRLDEVGERVLHWNNQNRA